MIAVNHKLPISHQAKLLGISRGSVYYAPRPTSSADLALMRRMNELHLEYPFMGSRQLQDTLVREDYQTGRAHVSTLMKRMGMEALYRKPGTSKKHSTSMTRRKSSTPIRVASLLRLNSCRLSGNEDAS